MHRVLLLLVLLAMVVPGLGCSGDESKAQKTPEEIAELEADCIVNTPFKEGDDLSAVTECLERVRKYK